MLVELKMWIVPVAALIPLIMGFIWYNPKVLGTAWMNVAGLTEETMKGANMGMIFGLSYIFSCFVGFGLIGIVIHQMGFQSMVMESGEITMELAEKVMELAGNSYRTFKHGVLHGTVAGLTLAFPVMAINALFERKGWKYIWINVGYWVISFALMGGVICQYA